MKKYLTKMRNNNFGQSPLALAAIVLLALFGTAFITYGLAKDTNDSVIVQSETKKDTTPIPEIPGNDLARSEPASIQLPTVGIDSGTIKLGKNTDGTVEVPAGENEKKVGWYKYSSTPGDAGSSVYLGHYDSKTGPSVFYKLQELNVKDPILVNRADGSQVKYDVTRVESYPKNEFPTDLVYGSPNDEQIRLVTCGGEFNNDLNDYEDNIVVSGRLSK